MMTKQTILDYLNTHKKEFQEEYEIEKIGLFGSYARDEAGIDSDIDIFVKMKPDFFKLMGLKQQIEENLNMKTDIVRLRDKMNMTLKSRILKDGIYV